jgi:hypothetical protein
MKYFTPQRYVALQDFSSDAAMDAADAAWEQAVEQYDAYYRSVDNALPAKYRRLQETYYLHDAVILFLGQQGDRFVIALQLDPPPQQILQLSYELAGEPRIYRDVLPSIYCDRRSASWQYDEVELVSQDPLVCVHSILLSNGWEVQLPFRVLQIEEAQALLPAPRNESSTSGVAHEAETV